MKTKTKLISISLLFVMSSCVYFDISSKGKNEVDNKTKPERYQIYNPLQEEGLGF